MTTSVRKRWFAALGLVVTVGLFFTLLRRLDAGRIVAAFGHAQALPLGLAMLVALAINLPLSALALRSALAAHGVRVPLRTALSATLGHLALHAGLSLVVGKPARALFLKREHGVDAKAALAAEFTLLVAKVASLLVLTGVGAALMHSSWYALGVLLILAWALSWARRGGARGVAIASTFVWSTSMAAGQLVVFALCLWALGSSAPLGATLLFFPLCLLGAKLPVALMGLGVRETLVVVLMSGVAPAETLFGAALAFSLLEQVLPGLVGLVFAPRFVERALSR
ncbi:MAG: flippase-like domain-containing protein [Myxococcales bacterium]|nr:flippase-like domain-containing protein [Myxococcales bacterium]